MSQAFEFSLVQPISSEPNHEFLVFTKPVGKDPCPRHHPSLGYHAFSPFSPQLQRKAKITSAVAKILLPSPRDSVKPGHLCLAAGWGKTGVKEPLSVKLREVTLRIMGKEACKSYSNYTDDFQVCVGCPGNIQSVFEVRTDIFSLPTEECQRREWVNHLSTALAYTCVLCY